MLSFTDFCDDVLDCFSLDDLIFLLKSLLLSFGQRFVDCRATVINRYVYVVFRTTLNVVFRSSCDSMEVEITKYIPSDKRLAIAQEVVEEEGIRPLARQLDVNPKSVYKYKKGNAHPGDEVMSKILSIAEEDTEIDLDEHLDELREDFLSALESRKGEMGAEEESEDTSTESGTGKDSEEVSKEDSVGPESTEEKESPESVDEKTTESLDLDEICDKIDVTSPFNRTKVEKLLGAMKELENPEIEELIEESNLSRGAVEKYLERLQGKDLIDKSNEGTYNIKINISEGN